MGSSVETEARVLEARFGDGYAARAADGINSTPELWTGRFDPVTKAVHDDIVAFLKLHGGHTPFLCTPPGDVQKRFVCKRWSRVVVFYGVRSIEVTFEQDYSI